MVQFASYLRCVLCKMRLIFPRIPKWPYCVVSSYLTRLFDLCTCAGNSRSYTFLTMAEVAEVEDGVVIIDCVTIFL